MAERRAPHIWFIPVQTGFADALVEGLIARHARDPLALAAGKILVPNNRAVRVLRDAFVRRAEGGLLMPRLVPIGDLDLGEDLSPALDPLDDADPLPPAIDPVARQMLLARMVQAQRARFGDPVEAADALRLASDLAAVLDQLQIARIDPRALKTLESLGELSIHWQASLALLTIILDQWPDVLARHGALDPAERRNRVLDRLSCQWRHTPPRGFVVAAGIATTAPAIAGLLRTIAHMDHGCVVLAGLFDSAQMSAVEWDALGPHDRESITGRTPRALESHPQFHLKLLLDQMGIARQEVDRWPWPEPNADRDQRGLAIANAMMPAAYSNRWAETGLARALPQLSAFECATPAEEAQAIALLLREAIETPGRTAALVTPDRALAARVSAHLARWGIEADDSAGRPLSRTPHGTLVLAVIEAVASRFAPVHLLGLLKHPLVRSGDERLDWLKKVRALDLALRGPRPPAGLIGITTFLAGGLPRERKVRAVALQHWPELSAALDPLEAGLGLARGLPDQLGLIRTVLDALSGEAVWSGPGGRALSKLFETLERHAGLGPDTISILGLGKSLLRMMDAIAVRPPQGGHPRIAILGLLESRLQMAGRVILGGLNEGVWPPHPSPDPWLAPRIRAELGLPALERRIGLAGHDLATALGGDEVVLTRAKRDATGPRIASRFWLRLEAMTKGMARVAHLSERVCRIDQPKRFAPIARPAPCPPRERRPQRISVTTVDRLKSDPFAFYAKAILRLAVLDPIDAEPGPAWRGTAVHAILEEWAATSWDHTALKPIAARFFARPDMSTTLRALWQPRVVEALAWISATLEKNRTSDRVPLAAEIAGRMRIAGVEVDGRADRIDRMADGSLAIVDYKTGGAPSIRSVKEGFSLQLGLLGAIAADGGFKGIDGQASVFEYWSLARVRDGFGKTVSPCHPEGKGKKIMTRIFVETACAHFAAAAGKWLTGDDPFVAKLVPEHAPYSDYDQLMRLDEWYGRNSEDG